MSLIATFVTAPENSGALGILLQTVASRLGNPQADWLADDHACDLALPPNMARAEAEAFLKEARGPLPVDLAVQEASSRRKKVLIADMDCTMIEQECIDELAAEAGVGEEIAAITVRAMNGEIEFEPAVRERVSLLANQKSDIVDTVLENRISFTPGGRALVQTMKANGCYCALVSGGFTAFTGYVAAALGFDEHRANTLDTRDGYLTGKVVPPILGANAKVDAMADICDRLGVIHEDFLAVGDGANDVPMLKRAGTGIAMHAKPTVKQAIAIHVDHTGLDTLLYFQGYRQEAFRY